MRGSIPTYWSQETSVTNPKPPININRIDSEYLASQQHFSDMFSRYNTPVIVLDLVKQNEKKPREALLSREYKTAIEVVNETLPIENKIRYISLDYSKITSISKGKLSKQNATTPSPVNNLPANNSSASTAIRRFSFKQNNSTGSERNNFQVEITAKSNERHPRALSTIISSPTALNNSNFVQFDKLKTPGKPISIDQITTPLPSGLDNIADVHAVESRIDVLKELDDIAKYAIRETGFFSSTNQFFDLFDDGILNPNVKQRVQKYGNLTQHGVLRTNCIDCLDRTNGGQFAVAMRFLYYALGSLGIISGSEMLESSSVGKQAILYSLMQMYGEMGDKIALQYGGSEAHNKVLAGKNVSSGSTSTSSSSSSGKQSEFLTSIKRYYSNAFTDMVKQDAMNLFLGYFIPSESSIPLWDLESDYLLHNLLLRPPSPLTDLVLYKDIKDISQLLSNSKLKLKIEVLLKRAFVEAGFIPPKINNQENNNASLQGVLKNKVNNDDKDNDSTESSTKISKQAKTLIQLDKLLEIYYIKRKQPSISPLPSPKSSSTPTSNTTTLVNANTIRTIGRLERRKYMRILASKSIKSASEKWWKIATNKFLSHQYDETDLDTSLPKTISLSNLNLRISNKSDSSNNKDSTLTRDELEPSLTYYERVYRPDTLTEFDVLLSQDFINPIQVVENDEKDSLRPTLANRTQSIIEDNPSLIPTSEANNTNNDLSMGLSTLTSLFSLSNSTSNDSHKHDDRFQISKFAKDISSKAKTLVGGISGFLLKKGNHSQDLSESNHLNKTINFNYSNIDFQPGNKYSSINEHHQYLLPYTISLYNRYYQHSLNPLLLITQDNYVNRENFNYVFRYFQDYFKNSNFKNKNKDNSPLIPTKVYDNSVKFFKSLSEFNNLKDEINDIKLVVNINDDLIIREYRELIRDTIIDLNDVKGMEELGIQNNLSSIVHTGEYQDLNVSSNSKLVFSFLFQFLTQMEEQLHQFSYLDHSYDPVSNGHNISHQIYLENSEALSLDKFFLSSQVPKNLHQKIDIDHVEKLLTNLPNVQNGRTTIPEQYNENEVMINQAFLENSNKIQSDVIDILSKFNIGSGIETELKSFINNYIFQQYMYKKELSLERLSRRISQYTTVSNLLLYTINYDRNYLAGNWEDLLYIASSNPNFVNYKEIFQLQNAINPNLNMINLQSVFDMTYNEEEEKKNKENIEDNSSTISSTTPSIDSSAYPITSLYESIRNDKEFLSNISDVNIKLPDPSTLTSQKKSISSELGINIKDLEEDLLTNYNLDNNIDNLTSLSSSFSSYDSTCTFTHYPYNEPEYKPLNKIPSGYSLLTEDLYYKNANPHLHLNEVALLNFI